MTAGNSLGVKILLSCDKHVKSICKKANSILVVLARAIPYLDIGK